MWHFTKFLSSIFPCLHQVIYQPNFLLMPCNQRARRYNTDWSWLCTEKYRCALQVRLILSKEFLSAWTVCIGRYRCSWHSIIAGKLLWTSRQRGYVSQLRANSKFYKSLHCTQPCKPVMSLGAYVAGAMKLTINLGKKKIRPEAKKVSGGLEWDFYLITPKMNLFLF